jgi:hypothetical protein
MPASGMQVAHLLVVVSATAAAYGLCAVAWLPVRVWWSGVVPMCLEFWTRGVLAALGISLAGPFLCFQVNETHVCCIE